MHEAITGLDQMIAKMNLYSTASAAMFHRNGRRARSRPLSCTAVGRSSERMSCGSDSSMGGRDSCSRWRMRRARTIAISS